MDSPLRVLHVVVNMNRGGAETLLMNLYRHIHRSKIQFDFLTCKPGEFDQEIEELGGRVHRIPYVTDVGHYGFMQELQTFFKEHQEYKIIHTHLDKMSGFILKAANKANIPIRIAHSHNTESEGGYVAKLYKWYAGTKITANATHLYACSHKAATWLFGKQSKKAHLLKNGIETDKFTFSTQIRKQKRQALQIEENAFVIGHVGRFSHQKNHLFLLELCSKMIKNRPNVQLVLVGDGALREQIIAKITELDLNNHVKLLGVRADTNELLQAFDVFMMPSIHEGLPVTLIEAQAAGLPCFISDTITREVDLGIGLVNFLPLKDKKAWLKRIHHFLPKETDASRFIPQTTFEHYGYDIRQTAAATELTYLKLGEHVL